MALRRIYPSNDALARALSLVGDRWTLLILREVFEGRGRFCEIKTRLGIASNVLAMRLSRLVEDGLIQRKPLADDGRASLYTATARARQLLAVIKTLEQFADQAEKLPEGDRGLDRAPLQLARLSRTSRTSPSARS